MNEDDDVGLLFEENVSTSNDISEAGDCNFATAKPLQLEGILLESLPVGRQPQELVEDDFESPPWQDLESAFGAGRDFLCFTGRVPCLPVRNAASSHSDVSMSRGSTKESMRRTCQIIDGVQFSLVQDLADRAFSLGSVLELVCILLDKTTAFAMVENLEAAYVYNTGIALNEWPDLSFFDPAKTQTWEVTYRCLVPLTKKRQCAFAKILTGDKRCTANHMVSHTWKNTFLDTIAACVAAVQGHSFYFHIRPRLRSVERVLDLMRDLGPDALETTFWLCAISVNQHTVACHESPWPCPCGMTKITEGPLSEVGSFDLMIQYLAETQAGFTQVVAADDDSSVQVDIKGMGNMDQLSVHERKTSVPGAIRARSTGSSKSSKTSKTSCGFQIDWNSRCVVAIDEDPKVMLSRSVFVGDIIESVNGNTKDVAAMASALTCMNGDVTIILRRKLAVTTRIWVVAEIAEVHKRKIPQHVVCHFPMALSGQECRLRVQATDISVAEASMQSDRELILGRIGSQAADYNKRLRKALLAVPIEWVLVVVTLCVIPHLLRCFFGLVTALQDRDILKALLQLSFAGEPILLVWSLRFVLRYFWVLKFLNDMRLSAALRKEIRSEADRYFEPHRNPLWTRPFLFIGFLWSPSLKQRTLAMTLLCSFAQVPQIVLRALSPLDADNEDCRDRALVSMYTIVQFLSFIIAMWSFQEQRISLLGKSSVTFLLLIMPNLLTYPAWMVVCTDTGPVGIASQISSRVLINIVAFDEFRKNFVELMTRCVSLVSALFPSGISARALSKVIS